MDKHNNEQDFNINKFVQDIDDDEDEDILIERTQTIIKQLDPEILQYFDEANILNRKSSISKSKKKKKDKYSFQVDQKILYNGKICSIIYGPYDKETKVMYELETASGEIVTAGLNDIKEIQPE